MNKKFPQNFFKGEEAVLDFLKPGALGPTPVVELPSSLNPFRRDGVRIFVKLMQFVPLFNIKSLPSYAMLSAVPKEKLGKIKNLVEYSSGNTVLSLAVLSRHFGIPNMHAIITSDVPEHKKRLLRLVGANILVSHGPPSPDVFANVGGVYEAKMLGQKSSWHNLQQYTNPANQKASGEYIGRELFEQFDGKLGIFMASIGTAGTIAGAGAYLRDKIPNVRILGTAIKKGSSIPGPRGEENIRKLAFRWDKVAHEVVAMRAKESFKSSLDLIRLGIFAGPSTGMQLAALLKKLGEYKKTGRLKSLRDKNGEVTACFLACDTMYPYIDEYFLSCRHGFFRR